MQCLTKVKKQLVMQQPATDKKIGLIILTCAISLGVVLFLLNSYTTKSIDEMGVFIIAKITHRERAKNGTDYSIYFEFDNRVYTTGFSSIPNGFLNKDSLVYLKILPNSPKTFKYIEFRVPPCLSLKDSPYEGWTKLPVTNCK